MRLPVHPVPLLCLLKDFINFENRTAYIIDRRPCNTHERCNTCAILRKIGKVNWFKAVAGTEPTANGIGTVYSVVAARRLIHAGGYLAGYAKISLTILIELKQYS
jgi:hypothetical protein